MSTPTLTLHPLEGPWLSGFRGTCDCGCGFDRTGRVKNLAGAWALEHAAGPQDPADLNPEPCREPQGYGSVRNENGSHK